MTNNNIPKDLFCILPDEVIDAILVRLPIRDAVRTCILSNYWKFKWHTMSKLVFKNDCLPSSTDQGDLLNKLVRIVDYVLSVHVGYVRRFELSAGLPSSPDVDRWITILAKKEVKEICMYFDINGAPYIVPSFIFRCQALKYLSIWNCTFKIPASFQQLSKLKTLSLREVSFPEGRLEALISSCPSLKILSLLRSEWPDHVKINSPNLVVFVIDGNINDLSFGDVPLLSHVSFSPTNIGGQERSMASNNLVVLPNLQKLHLGGCAMKTLHRYINKLPMFLARHEHLKSLYLHVDFQSKEEYKTALCLITSPPNLEQLIVQASLRAAASTSSTYSWKPEDCVLTFNHLKRVIIAGMVGTEQEMHLMTCLLCNAPLLERITISMNHEKSVIAESEIIKDLMRHQRASTKAKIICKEIHPRDLHSAAIDGTVWTKYN